MAASFTDVPKMAAALQSAAAALTEIEKLVEANPGARTLFNPVLADLRKALTMDGAA